MCYVIYTGVGREQQVKKLIDRTVPRELYTRCFYPYRHMRKKIAGSWADIYEWLIPGYLFVITDRVAEFSVALGSISRGGRYVRLLGGGKSGARAAVNTGSEATGVNADTAFSPVDPAEEAWLRRMLGDRWFDIAPGAGDPEEGDNAVADLSAIDFDENDRVRILSGPLMNFSGNVRRIDLHRRLAEVEVPFMGTLQCLRLGVEILVRDGEE